MRRLNSFAAVVCIAASFATAATCPDAPTTFHLGEPPYENYFYSDCHSASQVVVTSPLPDSNLTIIGPRLLVCDPEARPLETWTEGGVLLTLSAP